MCYTLEELYEKYGKDNVVPSFKMVDEYDVKLLDDRYEVDTMFAYNFIAIFEPNQDMPIAQYTLDELRFDGTVTYSKERDGEEELKAGDLWTRESVAEFY